MVLALDGPEGRLHYTPDIVIEIEGGGAVVEVKGQYFLSLPEQRELLCKVGQRLHERNIKFVVMRESEVREDGLQEELAELLRLRPLTGRYRDGLNNSAWDPIGSAETDFELEARWLIAQRECDALIERVMRRDPGELVVAAN
jgi:hypothetical protein